MPDPAYNAYRHDLADLALADRVIAPYYAEPREVKVLCRADLRENASAAGAPILQLLPGNRFRVLESKLGWAWGYAPDGRVGYIDTEALDLQ